MSSAANGTSGANGADNPNDNHGPVVTAVTAWMLAFSGAFIVLRCVSRLMIVKRWGWDDSFIIVAWVGLTICQHTSAEHLR